MLKIGNTIVYHRNEIETNSVWSNGMKTCVGILKHSVAYEDENCTIYNISGENTPIFCIITGINSRISFSSLEMAKQFIRN